MYEKLQPTWLMENVRVDPAVASRPGSRELVTSPSGSRQRAALGTSVVCPRSGRQGGFRNVYLTKTCFSGATTKSRSLRSAYPSHELLRSSFKAATMCSCTQNTIFLKIYTRVEFCFPFCLHNTTHFHVHVCVCVCVCVFIKLHMTMCVCVCVCVYLLNCT